jgi:hypothetical protein
MIKRHRNNNHLNSLILGTIESNRVDELKHYISVYPKDLLQKHKNNHSDFLESALVKARNECAKFLIEFGFIVRNPEFIILDTKIENLPFAMKNMESLGFHFRDEFKSSLVLRILEPYKVLDNPKRIDIALEYLESGFFTECQFEEGLDKIEKANKGKRFERVVKSYIREYKLNKIL